MPLTQEQKQWVVQQQGLDPSKYDVDENSMTFVPIVRQQPAVNPTPYEPQLTTGIQNQDAQQSSGSGSAFLKSAIESAPSAITGGGAAALAGTGLTALGLDMTGVGAIAGIPLMALAAYGAAKGTRKLQQTLEPQEWQQGVAQAQAEHPIASTAGQLATIPLGGFGPNSPGNIAKAAGAIPKLLTGMSLEAPEAAQLANVGIGALLPPIQNIAESQIEGQPMPSMGSLLGNAAVGAVMSRPNTIGKMMGFHEAPSSNMEFTPEMLQRINKVKGQQQEPAPLPIDQLLPARYNKVPEDLSTEEQQRLQLEQTGLKSGSLQGAQERSNKMASYKSTPEPVEPAIATAEGEGNVPIDYRSLAKEAQDNLVKQGVSKEESTKALQLSPDEQKELEQWDLSEGRTKYQQQSNLPTQEEKLTQSLLKQKGYTGNLTPEWFALASKLSGKRGAALESDLQLPTAGSVTLPEKRTMIGNIVAKINTSPGKAGADTPTHELLHIFVNDLRNSNRVRDEMFVRKYDDLVTQNPDYQKWSAARKEQGIDASPEEYQATNQGMESINRALSDETPFQKWKNDFGSYLKTRWSKYADIGDFQRIMNYKLLNDPAYYKILGLKGLPGGLNTQPSVVTKTKNEEQSSILNEPKPSKENEDKTKVVNDLFKRGNITLDDADKLLIGNTKNQEASNLVTPNHDSVKEYINDAISGTEDPTTMTVEQLDKIHAALRDNVKWPTGSNVENALKSEKFDATDPEHWQDLRKLYNAETYPTEDKQKNAEIQAKASEATTPAKVEVPRTIPEKAMESAKAIPSEAAKERTGNTTTPKLKYTPGEKLTSQELGGSVKPISESQYKRTPFTKEEISSQKDLSKMAWDEIDNTKDPQATMNKLQDSYEYALQKEHSARAIGDKDQANSLANLRTATLMRMHYLGEKRGIEVPSVERFQEHSNLANEEQALPNLHNRIQEFGKNREEATLPYSTPKMFTAQLDKVKKIGTPEAKDFAKEYETYVPLRDQLFGKYNTPVHDAMKGLNVGDKNKVENVLIQENRDKQFHDDLLNTKQKVLYDAVREALKQKQQDQIDANQPVSDFKANGDVVKRLPKIDPYYYPNHISPKVAEQLAENTPAAKNLKQDFLDYQHENGISDEEAQSKLDTIIKAYDVGKPNLEKFGAVRKAEGIGLPDSWMRNGIDKNLSSYFNRVAADRAYHDTFEQNGDVMKSVFGQETDPWGKPYNSETDADISGNNDVKAIAERIHGEPFSKDESMLKAFNRVATSLMLGPLTNVHIAASSIANSLQYLKPLEAPGALIHSLTHLVDGYHKAVEQGRIKPSTTTARDIVDINNTALEKWRATSDLIGKINGRELTNNFTNAYLQNVGEWIVKSKAIQANAGDKAAIDIMRKADPSWEEGKTYTPEEIESLGSTFASTIHGGHDARTLPGWMLRDTAIQPFFSLASWNIAQTNAWMRHVYTPAKNGNFVPLIMSTLGGLVGGYVVKQGRELISDKKSPIPSLTEIMNSNGSDEQKAKLFAYNALAMGSYTGFAGILSTAGKAMTDIAYKNLPQTPTFPLDEVMGSSAHRITQFVQAWMNDPNMDFWQSGTKVALDLAKENMQLARIGISWLDNTDIAKEIPGLKQDVQGKQINQKTANLRRFKVAEGMPYDAQILNDVNPYISGKLKAFKRSEDIGEAVSGLPSLLNAAFEKANGNIDVLRGELHKLKANTYETMPDPERMPMSFVRYLNFLSKTQGSEAATDRLMDYVRRNAINKAKASLVPSL